MALVDVGIRGLEFEVPDDWSEDQVNQVTRTRYPFLFPDIVAAREQAAKPPTIDDLAPGPLTIAPGAMGPRPEALPVTPSVSPAPPAAPTLPPPADPMEAAFRDRFPTPAPATGTPSFLEALSKEYLRTVSGAAPTAVESLRMAQNAFGPGALADYLTKPKSDDDWLARMALRAEAARLDPMYTGAREMRQAADQAYDYNRKALPAWQQKPAEWLGSGLGSATTFIPATVLGVPGIFGMSAALTFSPAYEEARRQGATPEQALLQAITESAAEGLSELALGAPGKIARILKKAPPAAEDTFKKAVKEAAESRLKTLAKTVGQEAVEEPISGTASDISAAYITGTDTSRGVSNKKQIKEFIGRRVDDFMGGAAGGLVFTPVARAAMRQELNREVEALKEKTRRTPPRLGQPTVFTRDDYRRGMRAAAFKDFSDGTPGYSEGDAVSVLSKNMNGVAQRMRDEGYSNQEIEDAVGWAVNEVEKVVSKASEEAAIENEEARTEDFTPKEFQDAVKAAGIPKEVRVDFNTSDAKTIESGGRRYYLPGVWDGSKITVWTRNVRSYAHLVAVLKEENNHRIISTKAGQAALDEFLAKFPVDQMLASGPEWLRKELTKYEVGDRVLADEFIAKLGAETTWKQWVAQARIFFKKLFGRELTAEETARVLLRQLQRGKFSVAPVAPTPVAEPEEPAAPATPTPPEPKAPPEPAVAPEPPTAAAPVEPAAAPPSPEAESIPLPGVVVTREVRQTLLDAGYTNKQIDSMKPEDALRIASGGKRTIEPERVPVAPPSVRPAPPAEDELGRLESEGGPTTPAPTPPPARPVYSIQEYKDSDGNTIGWTVFETRADGSRLRNLLEDVGGYYPSYEMAAEFLRRLLYEDAAPETPPPAPPTPAAEPAPAPAPVAAASPTPAGEPAVPASEQEFLDLREESWRLASEVEAIKSKGKLSAKDRKRIDELSKKRWDMLRPGKYDPTRLTLPSGRSVDFKTRADAEEQIRKWSKDSRWYNFKVVKVGEGRYDAVYSLKKDAVPAPTPTTPAPAPAAPAEPEEAPEVVPAPLKLADSVPHQRALELPTEELIKSPDIVSVALPSRLGRAYAIWRMMKGDIMSTVDARDALAKYSKKALEIISRELGIPRPETKDALVQRMVAYRRIWHRYLPTEKETPEEARDRVASENTDAALRKDIDVINGFKSAVKLGKAAQLVSQAIKLREAAKQTFVRILQAEAIGMAKREGKPIPEWLQEKPETEEPPVSREEAVKAFAAVAEENRRKFAERAAKETSGPQPNEHGVYKEDVAERVEMPRRKRDPAHSGARVRVLKIDRGWISSVQMGTATSGYSDPLTASKVYPTREEAVLAGLREGLRWLDGKEAQSKVDGEVIERMRQWLFDQIRERGGDPDKVVSDARAARERLKKAIETGAAPEAPPVAPEAPPVAPETPPFNPAEERARLEAQKREIERDLDRVEDELADIPYEATQAAILESKLADVNRQLSMLDAYEEDAAKPEPTVSPETIAKSAPLLGTLRSLLAKTRTPKERVTVSKTGAELARTITAEPEMRKFRPFARLVLADLGDAARPFLLSWYTQARISDTKNNDYDPEAEATAAYEAEFADRTRASLGEVYTTLDDAIRDSGRRAVSGGLRAGRRGGGRPGAKVVRAELIPPPRSYVTADTYAPGFRLTPHQVLGVNRITDHFEANPDGGAFLLADGTGFGKTAQLLAAADQYWKLHPGARILLVSMNAQILETRFKADMKRMGIVPGGELVLSTYKVLHELDRKKGFDLALYDEAHSLKNDTSRRSVAAALLPAKHRIYATATPMDAPTHAAYFLAEALGEDEATIGRELGYDIVVRMDPWTKEEIPYAQLRPGFSWHKVWANIIAYRDALIEAGAMVRREYPYFGDIIHDDKPLDAKAKAEEARIIRYYDRLIESTYKPSARRNYAGQKTGAVSRWTELQKVDRALTAIREWIAAHPKGQVVVVGETAHEQSFPVEIAGAERRFNKKRATDYWYAPGALDSIRDVLAEEGVTVAEIYGDADKSGEVEAFQAGQVQVGLTTPQSGGAGIDLDDTAGDAPRLLIMLSKNFAADTLDQILGRVSRMNTKSESLATFLTTDSFSDARRELILDRKLKTLRAIQGGEDADIAAGGFAEEATRASMGEPVTTTISGEEQTLPREQAVKRARGLDYTLRRLLDCLAAG